MRLNSTWYEHKQLAEAERLSPGFCRDCDEERKKHRRFSIRDALRRAQKIAADARKAKEDAAAL